jgi:glycine cleavage system regulatory protein
MTTPLVLTFLGDDRPGLVNAISERIAACGGTWLESRSARLAGKFAGILLVNVADDQLAGLESSLRQLESAGLRLTIDRGAAPEGDRSRRLITLDLVGHERPGIVRDVTQALSHLGVNIEEFVSGLEGAPFTGEAMFRATARLRPPDGLALEDLRKSLERLAGEIMVDLTVGEGETHA